MNDNREMYWAFVVAISLGSCLASVGYIFSGTADARQEIFQIANALVSGAMGFFAGRASVNRNPLQPVEPAQPSKEK